MAYNRIKLSIEKWIQNVVGGSFFRVNFITLTRAAQNSKKEIATIDFMVFSETAILEWSKYFEFVSLFCYQFDFGFKCFERLQFYAVQRRDNEIPYIRKKGNVKLTEIVSWYYALLVSQKRTTTKPRR